MLYWAGLYLGGCIDSPFVLSHAWKTHFNCLLTHPLTYTYVTQRQLMRLFAVKLILSYEQKCQGQNFSKIKVPLKTNFDINSMSS